MLSPAGRARSALRIAFGARPSQVVAVIPSWPGVRDDLVNAGATWVDQPLVRDGNLATSRGRQDIIPFVQGCLDLFAQDAPIARHPPVSTSSLQANEPPEIVLDAMKWLPNPSVRTALGLGAIAAVFMATRARRGNGEVAAADLAG